jgi:hypothetical protein
MSERLRHLPLHELRPGMVLGHPIVLTERGIVVLNLPAGHVLNEASLAQLAARHAEYAAICEPETRSPEALAALRAREEARLALIFSNADLDHPDTRAFYEAVLAYRSA